MFNPNLTLNTQKDPNFKLENKLTPIDETTMFAIFDAKSNVHMIKPKNFEYKLIPFNIK